MTEGRFTAPVAGTYLFVKGQEPRLLTPEEVAERLCPPGAQTIRFQAGDGIMRSGGHLSPTDGTFSIPWNSPSQIMRDAAPFYAEGLARGLTGAKENIAAQANGTSPRDPCMPPTMDDLATWGRNLPNAMVEAICTELEGLGWDIEYSWNSHIEAQFPDPVTSHAMRFSGWIISWRRIDGNFVYGIGDDLIDHPHRVTLLEGPVDNPKIVASAADKAMHLLWHQEEKQHSSEQYRKLDRYAKLERDIRSLGNRVLVTPGQIRGVLSEYEATK